MRVLTIIALVCVVLLGQVVDGVAQSPAEGQTAADHVRDALQTSPARLIGMTRDSIEAKMAPTGGEADWVFYGPELVVRYQDGVAVALRINVQAETCADAALMLGFADAGAPMRELQRCSWPGLSDRHRLAANLAAELTFADAVFHVWLVED